MPHPTLVKAMEHIHTPESWARSVFYAAVKAQNDGRPLAGFTVTEGPECVQVCIDTPFGRVCFCV